MECCSFNEIALHCNIQSAYQIKPEQLVQINLKIQIYILEENDS